MFRATGTLSVFVLLLVAGSAFATAPAKQAVYEVQIIENGVMIGHGIEVAKVVAFDPVSQLYTASIDYSVTYKDGHIDKYSDKGKFGKDQEGDDNRMVQYCLSNTGASLETITTPAGTFKTCKGNWGIESKDGSIVSTVWIGMNARGYTVKAVQTTKIKSGSVSEVEVLKQLID